MLHKHATALIFRTKMVMRNDGNCRSSSFPTSVARMQRAAGKPLVVHYRELQRSFGRPVDGRCVTTLAATVFIALAQQAHPPAPPGFQKPVNHSPAAPPAGADLAVPTVSEFRAATRLALRSKFDPRSAATPVRSPSHLR
jgi:hypothetical protein